jgi:hydroxypyruvate isomerase
MGEDVLDVLSSHRDSILHVQVADPPGRGAPGTGTLDFDPAFQRLAELGYDGWVGLEYVPADPTDSASSFGWLASANLTSTNLTSANEAAQRGEGSDMAAQHQKAGGE